MVFANMILVLCTDWKIQVLTLTGPAGELIRLFCMARNSLMLGR